MRLAAPSMLVDINALPDLGHVTVVARGRGADRGPGPARRRARARPRRAQVQPLLAHGAEPRRPPDDPQPRHHRRLARARRRRGRDADGAAAAGGIGRRRVGARSSYDPGGGAVRRPARVDARPRRDRRRGVLPGARPRRRASRSTRSPGATATTRWSASPPSSRSTTARSSARARRLPLGERRPGRRRRHRASPFDDPAAAALRRARPGRGHPCHRRLPRPPREGADPARPGGRDDHARTRAGEATAVTANSSTTSGCTSTDPSTRCRCRRGACCPTRCATTAG